MQYEWRKIRSMFGSEWVGRDQFRRRGEHIHDAEFQLFRDGKLMGYRGYITGEMALDVARLTGLEVCAPGHRLGEDGDLSPLAVDEGSARGFIDRRRVFIDLTRLTWWDRFKVAWALIGGHTWRNANA